MNLSLIGASLYAIIMCFQYNSEIKEFVTGISSSFEFIASQTTQILISLINSLIPALTKFIIIIEDWDFGDTRIKNEIWRSYIS